MGEYTKTSENISRTLDSNPKASKQGSISEILQAYKNGTLQRMSVDEEELLQAKTRDKSSERETLQGYTEYTHKDRSGYNALIQGVFGTPQRKGIEDDELLQGKFDSSSAASESTVQREVKPNNTGLPDNLKSGIENLSGYSMDDVKVHYNSDKPAQLSALAYAQGTDIHVAPGQEQHLPHEAWHVVQQKQGRVQTTMQMQGVNVNDNKGLEREADDMGKRIVQSKKSKIYKYKLDIQEQKNKNIFQFSFGSWIKQSAISLFNLTLGSLFRVPKRIFNLAKHVTVDLVRSIYHAIRIPNTNGQAGLMSEQASMKTWIAELGTKFLDVLNLREIVGFLTTLLGMPLSQVRGLSDGEKNLARTIFGDSINLSDVTILENSAITGITAGPGGAFTCAHTIHADQPLQDPHNPNNHIDRQAILMHELMHIAQEQKQGILTWIELEWGRRRTRANPAPGPNPDYNYGIIPVGALFRDYSREQQGAIIQDYATYIQNNPIPPIPNNMINGQYGGGMYADYQIMLQGLRQGHWWLPFQYPTWKKTIG